MATRRCFHSTTCASACAPIKQGRAVVAVKLLARKGDAHGRKAAFREPSPLSATNSPAVTRATA